MRCDDKDSSNIYMYIYIYICIYIYIYIYTHIQFINNQGIIKKNINFITLIKQK